MIDFLNCYRPVVTSCRIECDTDGCESRITIPNDIDEAQAMAVARAAGWSGSVGALRDYHRCTRCTESKR